MNTGLFLFFLFLLKYKHFVCTFVLKVCKAEQQNNAASRDYSLVYKQRFQCGNTTALNIVSGRQVCSVCAITTVTIPTHFPETKGNEKVSIH